MVKAEHFADNVTVEGETANLVHAGRGIRFDLGRGTGIEVLSPEEETSWVLKATLQPGAVVPVHSHHEQEDFYMLSGQGEALVQTENGLEWKAVQAGDFIHIPGNAKHAWRNRFPAPAETLVVTPARLGRFLRELGEQDQASGSTGAMEALLRISQRYGYWLGSPEENAAVGISLP
jgi:quercetin dioxygenase-like cupin family protein